jgi:hypothetical protein
VDDMGKAEECPIMLVCFPKEHSRGTMTYGEIGGSRAKGNYIIIADETDKRDNFLDSISDSNLNSIDDAINFLKKENPRRDASRAITKKQNKDNKFRIFLATDINYFMDIEKVYQDDENKILMYGDFANLENFGETDLTVTHFPEGKDRDRKAIFFMGLSYALEIPSIVIDENKVLYPPLEGLAKRNFHYKSAGLDYLVNLKSLEIEKESKVYYWVDKKYNISKP